MADLKKGCIICGNKTTEVEARRSGAQRGLLNSNQDQAKEMLTFIFQLYGWGLEDQNLGVGSLFERDYYANPKDRVYFCSRCFKAVKEIFLEFENVGDNEDIVADMKEFIKDLAMSRLDVDQSKITEGYESVTDEDGISINMRNMIHTYNSDTKPIVEEEAGKAATSCPVESDDSDSNLAENESSNSNFDDNEDSDSDQDKNKNSDSSLAETEYSYSNPAEKYEETAALVNNRTTRKRKLVNNQELVRDEDDNRDDNHTKPTHKTQDTDFVSTESTVSSGESDNVSDSDYDEETKTKLVKRLNSSKDSKLPDLTNSEESQDCPICKQKFVDSEAVDDHLKSIHAKSENEILSCSICGKRFVSEIRQQMHMKRHEKKGPIINNRSFKCSIEGCKWAFNTSRDLKTHENRHSGVKDHLCSLCGATFNHRWSFDRHKKTCGISSTPFACNLCGKKFKTNKYLDQHLNSQFHGGQGNKSVRRK